ncbi:class I SAM-dependent methyltransferase [Streptomyces violascens]|uniref:class I SAM-dependent methyltransferase n=1 Tax=Streptomyces violascens TaxID=67381 RepID=UPI0037B18C4C
MKSHAAPEYWDNAYRAGRAYRDVTPLERTQFQANVKTVPGMAAVDIGCGTGSWSRSLGSMGLSVTGYDFSNVAVDEARRLSAEYDALRFEVWDVNGDAIPRSLAPGSVDLITCRLAIAFLDRQRFLVDTSRWLKPDGIVHIVTPVHERLRPTEKHRGLTESEIDMLGAGWEHVGRYDVSGDGSITAILLQHYQ